MTGTSVVGHELPPLPAAGAAERPLITDMKPDGRRAAEMGRVAAVLVMAQPQFLTWINADNLAR